MTESTRPGMHANAVTVIVTRVVRPGREPDFALWADEVDAAAAEFAGHLTSIRLHDGQGLNHLVYQFDHPANLQRWERSARHRRLLQQGDELSDEPHRAVGGRNSRFFLPGGAPTRWKTFVLTWLGVYPTLVLIVFALEGLTSELPELISLAISSALLTALLTWVILPFLERHARPWLLRGAQPRRQERTGGTASRVVADRD